MVEVHKNKSTVKEILNEIPNKLKEKFGDKVKEIILFGSYVRGDYQEHSDIDILVIVEDDRIEKDVRRVVYSFIPRVGRLISVKVIKSDVYGAMKKMKLSFIQSVEREGITIG